MSDSQLMNSLQVALGGGKIHAPTVSLCLFWVVVVVYYALVDTACPLALGAVKANFPDNWWEAWSYALMHVDKEHVWGSILSLFVYGAWFEIVHGSVPMLGLLSVCTPMASYIHVATRNGPLLGLSGIIFGLMTAPLVTILLNWKEMSHPYLRLTAYIPLAAMIVWQQAQAPDEVSVEAHVAGAAGGVLVALAIGRNAILERWEAYVSIGASAAIVVFGLTAPMANSDLWIYVMALGLPGGLMLAQSIRAYLRLGSQSSMAQDGQEMATV